MNGKRMRLIRNPASLTLLIGALLLAACAWIPQYPPAPAPGEVELSFESIDYFPSYPPSAKSPTKPTVVLVTNAAEIEERLDHLVQDSTLERLQNLDFGQYFVLTVFRGRQAMGGYSVMIKRVARLGERLVVYAELGESPPNFPKPAASVAPYHVIQVPRDGGPLEEQDVSLLTWRTYLQ